MSSFDPSFLLKVMEISYLPQCQVELYCPRKDFQSREGSGDKTVSFSSYCHHYPYVSKESLSVLSNSLYIGEMERKRTQEGQNTQREGSQSYQENNMVSKGHLYHSISKGLLLAVLLIFLRNFSCPCSCCVFLLSVMKQQRRKEEEQLRGRGKKAGEGEKGNSNLLQIALKFSLLPFLPSVPTTSSSKAEDYLYMVKERKGNLETGKLQSVSVFTFLHLQAHIDLLHITGVFFTK